MHKLQFQMHAQECVGVQNLHLLYKLQHQPYNRNIKSVFKSVSSLSYQELGVTAGEWCGRPPWLKLVLSNEVTESVVRKLKENEFKMELNNFSLCSMH